MEPLKPLTDKQRRIVNLMHRITYKPDSQVNIMLDAPEYYYLSIQIPVYDAHNPKEHSLLRMNIRLPLKETLDEMTDDQIIKMVFDGIMDYERHEAQEWFKLDGKIIYDPHVDEKT